MTIPVTCHSLYSSPARARERSGSGRQRRSSEASLPGGAYVARERSAGVQGKLGVAIQGRGSAVEARGGEREGGEGGGERGGGTDDNILASGRRVEPPSIVGCHV
jgi:hypothetical protein